jgi:hypothetical protein
MTTRFGRRSVAPLLADWVCVLVFAALGKQNHGAAGGIGWYGRVWWPLAVGFVVGGLATRVYVDGEDWPGRVLTTVAIAVVVGGPLRWLTGKPIFDAFTLVAFAVLSAFTLGWRGAVVLVRRRRGASVDA